MANCHLDKLDLLTAEELIANRQSIPFELVPRKKSQYNNLTQEQKLIAQAARNNKVEYLRTMGEMFLAKEFNFQDQLGRTPLYIAVVNKNLESVKELIKIGVDVNAKCEMGNTCLHRMMLCKDNDPKVEQIINILLNNG